MVIGGLIFSAAVLTQTSTGLLFKEDFATLSNFNQYAGSTFSVDSTKPSYVFHPHDRILLPLASSGEGSVTQREVLPMRLEDGSLALFYDSADGSDYWRAAAVTSTDNGVTLTRRGKISFPLTNGHLLINNGFVFKHVDGYYYWYGLTADAVVNGDTPLAPYGNHLYKTLDLLNGPWTSVSDNDPPLPDPSVSPAYDNITYCILYNAARSRYEAFQSFTTYPGSVLNWNCSRYYSASPLGPWTKDTDDFFPASIQGSTYGGPENPRFWYSSTLGIWAGTANLVQNVGNNFNLAFYYAPTVDGFGTDGVARKTAFQMPDTMLTPGSPIYDLNKTVIEEADGAMGYCFSGRTGGGINNYGHTLRAGQLDPFPNALLFSGSGSPTYITRTQPSADGVYEFTVEHISQTGGAVCFIFNASTTGTDGSFTGYCVVVPTDTRSTSLFRVVGGTFTSVGSGYTYPSLAYTPNSLNRAHQSITVTKSGGVITVREAGSVLVTYTDGSPLTGTKCGFRGDTATMRVLGLHQRTGTSITVSGLTAGDVVSLHGAGKLPAVVGTATGSSITLTHSHFPLYGIQINGVYYAYPSGIYGGDAFTKP